MTGIVKAIWLTAAGLIGAAIVGMILAVLIGGTVSLIKKRIKEGRGHDKH